MYEFSEMRSGMAHVAPFPLGVSIKRFDFPGITVDFFVMWAIHPSWRHRCPQLRWPQGTSWSSTRDRGARRPGRTPLGRPSNSGENSKHSLSAVSWGIVGHNTLIVITSDVIVVQHAMSIEECPPLVGALGFTYSLARNKCFVGLEMLESKRGTFSAPFLSDFFMNYTRKNRR